MNISSKLQNIIDFSLESNTETALREFMRNNNYPSVVKTDTGVRLGDLNILLPEQKNAFTITHPCQDVLYICESVSTAQVLHKCALALAAAGVSVSDIQQFAAEHAIIFSEHPYIKSSKKYSSRAANKAGLIYLGFEEIPLHGSYVDYVSSGLDKYELPLVNADIYDSQAGHCCVNVNAGDYRAPVSTIEEIEQFSNWLNQNYIGWNA